MFESFHLEADTLALTSLDRNVGYLYSSLKKILIPTNDSDFNSTIRKYLLWVENKFICILNTLFFSSRFTVYNINFTKINFTF